jgi:prepilin-type processing-associated H-X9-DG protein
MNNWPDKGDNHGAKGINLGYVDGHVAFVDRGDMVRAFILSRHPWPCNDNATDIARALNAVKGLKCTTIGGSYWRGKWSYQ